MKTGFILPSCNYNIVLSKEELEQLINTGTILMEVSKTPCHTGRTVYTSGQFDTLDKKDICNNLCFDLSEDVADLKKDTYGVQFLTININKEVCTNE